VNQILKVVGLVGASKATCCTPSPKIAWVVVLFGVKMSTVCTRALVVAGGLGMACSHCSQDLQILYSLSAGLSSGTHDTSFYAGNIRAIDGDFESGHLGSGEGLGAGALESMKVATVSKVEGSPRALNWPIPAASIVGAHAVNEAVDTFHRLSISITESQILAWVENLQTSTSALQSVQGLATPEQLHLFASSAESLGLASDAFGFMYAYAIGLHLAKSLIWADSYHVTFTGNPTDELLVNLVAAVQDLTREQVALAPTR